MERRLFLTGMLGVAGMVTLAGVARPGKAVAGIPDGNGILDELDKPDPAVFEGDDQAEVEQVSHRRHHHHHHRRRHGWRKVCRRYWRHGRRHVRCWRRRVLLGIYL